jgi:integrase
LDRTRNPPPTISAAWQAYVEAGNRRQIGAWTQRNYAGYWRRFSGWLAAAEPEVSDLAGVSFSMAERYVADLASQDAKGHAPTGRTVNAHRAFLRAFWNVLKEKAGVPDNPWAKIAKRDEAPISRRPLSVAELREVCRRAQGELRLLLALGLFLGCRLGDAAMMLWANVDMRRREIHYMPRKTARKVGTQLMVPMHPELFALLAETPAADRKGYVVPEMAGRYQRTGPAGVTVWVQEHFAACGLERTAAREGAGQRRAIVAGFHSLRHAAVSLLREAGAAESVSMAIVGHNDVAVHAVYTHVGDSAMRQAVSTLPSVFGQTRAMLPPAAASGETTRPGVAPATLLSLADKLSDQTWAAVRDELRALAQEALA